MASMYSNNFENTTVFSDTNLQLALATGVVQTFALPGAATVRYQLRFSYLSTTNVFIGLNATPASPGAGAQTTAAYVEFRPGGLDGSKRYAKGGDVLSFITPDASAYVGVSIIQLPG